MILRRLAPTLGCLAALLATLAACGAAPPAPVTADGFTEMFRATNNWTWSGGDQATSFRASNGVTYWAFGDTIRGEQDPKTGAYRLGWQMVPNTILRQDGDALTAAVEGAAVPSALDGDRYWPMGMVEANGFLYVLCQRVRSTATFFELRGVELAKFEFRANGMLTFVDMARTPSTWALGGDSIASAQYGADAVLSDGWVYVFGFSNAPGDLAFPQRSYVAKVPAGQIEDPAAWSYWSADPEPRWVRDKADATPIAFGQVTSARIIGGQWVLAFKPWNAWGDTVQIEQRATPFAKAKATVRLSSPAGHGYVTYAPQLHPEQSLASGKLLVSVCYNGATLDDVRRDADLYKPRFFEVKLP